MPTQAALLGAVKVRKIGRPDPALVSAPYLERSNLTLRRQQRRFTRLTDAFSKKAEHHAHASSLLFMHHNCWHSHPTLTKANRGIHTTAAMAAGLTNHVWKVEDILALDPATSSPTKR